MDDENVVIENEILQNEMETGESVAEVVLVDYTELLEQIYGEMQMQTEVLEQIEVQNEFIAGSIGGLELLFGMVAVFVVIEFCWSCLRQWRKNVLKMGE